MKNTLKFLGIIALIAVIGFSMLACDDGNGNGGNDDDNGDTTVTAPLTSPGLWKVEGGNYSYIAEVPANDVGAAITRVNAAASANDGSYTLVIDRDVTLSARGML